MFGNLPTYSINLQYWLQSIVALNRIQISLQY